MAPIKSPKAAIIVLYFGPSQMADIIIGIKLVLTTNNCVWSEANRDRTIKSANKNADNIIFLDFDIKNSPFFIDTHHKERRQNFLKSLSNSGMRN